MTIRLQKILSGEYPQSDNTDYDEQDTNHPENIRRLFKINDPENCRADYANASPDCVSRAHGYSF